VRATISKKDAIAYFDGRNEFEIVADPAKLEIFPFKPPKRPPYLTSLLDQIWEGFPLSRNFSLHGFWHWEKGESNALALAKRTPGCDPMVVQLFAMLHDSKRLNEDDDPDHGGRAADYTEELFTRGELSFLSMDQKEKLKYACRLHNDGKL